MRIAKLPNGIKVQFPDSITDEDMDSMVQKYISTTEANVQKYLLNEEALQGIIKVSQTMSDALVGLNKLIATNQTQQTAMINKLDEILKVAAAVKVNKLQKSIDVLANTSHAAFTKIAENVGKLAKAVEAPIKFKYDGKGNVESIE